MKKQILWVVYAVIILLVLWLIRASSLLSRVSIQEKTVDPFVMVYADYIGDYKNVAIPMDSVFNKLLKEDGISTSKGIGIYYDNPEEVPVEKLRSKVGCILDEKDLKALPGLKKKYKVFEFKKTDALIVEFPFRSRMSIIAGVAKVYPAIRKYAEEKNYSGREMIEIYDTPGKKIVYIMPIRK